ncbi:hypothetical protein CYMTET_2837 [Cymbomonas tetramitiformis]|uniref:Uncharacterized protein n=1 Tax=Cymbomonas tetramitiformis TaxID=36881 RepID=A0AAE0H4D9_9CHLO|nr:hypothetical protein CYMTET_54245 [Cymbomonas tetramitiformis]KAK3289708.1 hypothetical protein CYMTET_2837 [Cymbomonas tetramitiformis]
MPDFSALSCLASCENNPKPPLIADPRHVPRSWCGIYERTNELSLKEVIAGGHGDRDRSIVRIDHVRVRYCLPPHGGLASRDLLRQLDERDLRQRDRVHLFRDSYYLGAYVVVGGDSSHVVLHLLRSQPDRVHIARRALPKLDQLDAERIVRSLVPSEHAVRVDAPVTNSETNSQETEDDLHAISVCSADVRRGRRVTWRFVLRDHSEESDIREWRQQIRCRAIRDALLQRVVLIRVRVDDEDVRIVNFRDFSDREASEREHDNRDTLFDAFFF